MLSGELTADDDGDLDDVAGEYVCRAEVQRRRIRGRRGQSHRLLAERGVSPSPPA